PTCAAYASTGGKKSFHSVRYCANPMPICRMFDRHLVVTAIARALLNAGNRIAISTAMIATVTSSSMSVNAATRLRIAGLLQGPRSRGGERLNNCPALGGAVGRRGGGGGTALNQLHGQNTMFDRTVGSFHALPQHFHGHPAQIGERLPHRGKPRAHPLGNRIIVETDNADVFGNPQARTLQGAAGG